MSNIGSAQAAASDAIIERAQSTIRLLGPPPVLITEDLDTYLSHRNYLLDVLKPRETAAVILVERYARKMWEIGRYDRVMAEIVELARKEALRDVLAICLPEGIGGLVGDDLVEAWSTNPETKRLILSRLASHHIGEEAITAKATTLRLDQLSLLGSMRDKVEAQARSLLREIAFYKSWDEPTPPANPAGWA